ncbi:PREDICTED: U11/U12 small nuclear ribonucleoprotein 25 kDa protein [Propithecus coquereli]|uniref:U11/U12 small nuclear ribonucleoprotein 25 kDa protein n=5 Tax=Boreoeutheria TaxID=1437010 RepID=A0A2K6FJ80_PROCO|nr:PREDICTED: U11/U12 small nuclear ribonucleoprotein 25 kDa protein [Propithecus coquereli]
MVSNSAPQAPAPGSSRGSLEPTCRPPPTLIGPGSRPSPEPTNRHAHFALPDGPQLPRVRAPPPRRGLAVPTEPSRALATLEEAEAAGRLETPQDDEDEEEALPHSEAVDVFQEGLAMVVQDPLLCDLPIQVTLEEVNSQIALEYGQAMTVRVCKMDGEVMPVVVVQNATVLDLKKAIQRYVQLKQEREGGIQHISWSYVWRTYHLTSAGEKLTEDRKKLRDYGIRNRDEVSFIKKLRQK